MDSDRENALMRRAILAAYVSVLDRMGELVQVCSTVAGGAEELHAAVQDAFSLSPIAADAVLAMQIRRFTPTERQRIVDELADVDLWLARNCGV